MRVLIAAAAAAAVLLAAGPAVAMASQVELTLRFRLADGTVALQPSLIPPLPFSTTGVVPLVTSGGPTSPVLHFPSGVALDKTGLTFPNPVAVAFPPIHGGTWLGSIIDPQLGPGQLSLLGLSLGSGAGGGRLPLLGSLFFARLSFVSPPLLPLTRNGTTGVGLGGATTLATTGLSGGFVRLSVQGAPWTVGSASLASQTANGALMTHVRAGFLHGPTSGTSQLLSAGGVMQMVSPIRIQTRIFENPVRTWGLFAELTLHFVPEPGAGAMLLFGAAGLGALGRRRVTARRR